MSLFPVTDNDRRIYEEQIAPFLPPKIIDIHTHVWLDRLRYHKPLKEGEVKRTVTWPSLVAKDNSVEDLQETYRLMFPDKQVTPLMFASGERESLPACNEYVKDAAQRTGYPALYYSDPLEDADTVEQRVREGGFLGLKSYLDLSPVYLPEAEIRIFDFFPKEQLKRMDRMGGIVMLHIPRNGRLKDPVNIAQIKEIKQAYPNIRLILAHIGRAYVEGDVGNAFKELTACAECATLKFDFCANTNEFAMTKLLEAYGPKGALFGSDLPILRMRMRRIEENNTYINLIPPGLYGDPSQDSHLREVSREEGEKLTFFMYEELMAFLRAAKNVGLSSKDLEDVFYNNAKALLDGAKASIYGTKQEGQHE
jgi:predicted TIM-barrel fold metal-dependent hydrolase